MKKNKRGEGGGGGGGGGGEATNCIKTRITKWLSLAYNQSRYYVLCMATLYLVVVGDEFGVGLVTREWAENVVLEVRAA